jgi:hypothetical protein
VLFDEIEKAHPDVFNVLLQVLDDGRLTDGQGRTVDFRNTLIIMTSNLGSEFLVNQPEGEDTSAVRDQVMGMVRAHFRPEFLNRVDEIILFHRLQKSEMGRIVEIQFTRLTKLLEDRKITLTLDASARDWLAEKGWDPAYGARPLKRVIQRSVQDPLAEMILAGEVTDGDTVKIATKGNVLTFNGKAAQNRRDRPVRGADPEAQAELRPVQPEWRQDALRTNVRRAFFNRRRTYRLSPDRGRRPSIRTTGRRCTGIDQQAFEGGRPAVAAEGFPHQNGAAAGSGHDVVHSKQFAIGAAGDFGQCRKRGGLAAMRPGERVFAGIVQCERVMIAGRDRGPVAGKPCGGVAGDGGADFCDLRGVAGRG